MKSLIALFASLCLVLPAFGAPPKIVNAADGIFAAFQSHPLVGLGESHGLAQELDFYATLVRDPRFATEVGNIVVESGDAAQQPVVDRYVNGEDVPYSELRKVWSDTVGFFPTVLYLGNINLYAVIRAVNQTLPSEKRIKVWLGDPPIDWSQIKTKDEWQPLENQRDSYPAALINREILSKNKKALVIYGEAHFSVYPMVYFGSISPTPNLRARLGTAHPGALYVVVPYVGYTTAACAKALERHLKGISAPSLISPIRGSSLENDILRPGCATFTKTADMTQEEYQQELTTSVGLNSDAFLYLGQRSSLLRDPQVPDIYLDIDYGAEMERRVRLRLGQTMGGWKPRIQPATAQPYWPD